MHAETVGTAPLDPIYIQYRKDESFRKQMDKKQSQYSQLLQRSLYSDLTKIDEEILLRMDLEREGQPKQDLYFFYGFKFEQTHESDIGTLLLFLIQKFNANPARTYTFVFFNHHAKSDLYGTFKQFFMQLNMERLAKLSKFVLVKPSFYHKAQDFLTYNFLPRYLRGKTQHIESAQELCSMFRLRPQAIVDLLPKQIAADEFPSLKPKQMTLQTQRINYEGQKMDERERISRLNYSNQIKAFLFVKSNSEKYELQDYEISKVGIPLLLELLFFFFINHPQHLETEGLFRKSVSIDEQNQTLNELANKNYDYLLQITNPHIVANLIKRFFANLNTPVIPYPQFEKLMHDQGIQDKKQHIKAVIQSIPQLNYLSLMHLLSFCKDYVIPREPHNRMSCHNISICFAPCLMRAEKASEADLIYASKCMMVTKMMIEHFEYVFGDQTQIFKTMIMSERIKLEQESDCLQSSLRFERRETKNSTEGPIRKSVAEREHREIKESAEEPVAETVQRQSQPFFSPFQGEEQPLLQQVSGVCRQSGGQLIKKVDQSHGDEL